eukprot:TRINITY_DN58004_c0_g1_i1.p1 TRINITY_DN58004_c0_g1~~TRINITY_DN58004_c0_g1_i1.p1  ORF type:complete len:1631 (-),score=287.31 TRINITY_DN58004_c0_g1_i1:88-4980(-)
MGDSTLAGAYFIFAVCTISLNLMSINVWGSNRVYSIVTDVINSIPFRGDSTNPVEESRYIDDITSPDDLQDWLRESFKEAVFREQSTSNLSAWGGFDDWNHSVAPPTIGSFNRMVMTRFTFKRWALKDSVGAFSIISAKKLHGGSNMRLDAKSQSKLEDKQDLCLPGTNKSLANWTNKCFQWAEKNSFQSAGGYMMLFDPMDGVQAYEAAIQKMSDSRVFNYRLATFVLDFIVYNTNLDLFQHYSLVFTFDFAGHADLSREARSFNLNMFNTEETTYSITFILRIATLVMLIVFMLIQFRSMWELGLLQHFRRPSSITELFALGISLLVLMSYWIIQTGPMYQEFNFADLAHPDKRAGIYTELCSTASMLNLQSKFIAFNLLVVIFRTTQLVGGLHSNMGLILEALSAAGPNLAAFILIFILPQIGFVFMAYFTFGHGWQGMQTIVFCVFRCFSFLSGSTAYDELTIADDVMGPIFFFTFHTLFGLVMINIFVTLLMSGYDVVDHEIKNRKGADDEKNPVLKVFDDVKADLFGTLLKYGSVILKYATICLSPIIVSVRSCFFCTPPAWLSSLSSMFVGGKQSRSHDPGDSDGSKQKGRKDKNAQSKEFKDNLVQFSTMLIFMCVWILLQSLQTRGLETFHTAQVALRESAVDVSFPGRGASDSEHFDRINSWPQVKQWADSSIVGLYADPTCAETVNNTPTWTSRQVCNTTSNQQQAINKIASWNIGFMNTTLVRLTIQPACIQKNPSSKWAKGFPTIRLVESEECAHTDCSSLIKNNKCFTSTGRPLHDSSLSSQSLEPTASEPNPKKYAFAEPHTDLGPYNSHGGFVFSLGVTQQQCMDKLRQLDQAGWFSQDSASMVFDWITYNGNTDMFTQSYVSFNLEHTGSMQKRSDAFSFPLNMSDGGGDFAAERLFIIVLICLYLCLLLYHIVDFVKLVRTEVAKNKGASLIGGIFNFFSDAWHVADTLSLTISTTTIMQFFVYLINDFRGAYIFSMSDETKYVVPNELAKQYKMALASNPARYLQDDWFIFRQFENTRQMYSGFMTFSALNSLFISIKLIKIVNRFQRVSVFSETLGNGKTRNFYFLVVIQVMLNGFGLALMVLFGTMSSALGSVTGMAGTMCTWICGDFYGLEDQMLTQDPIMATLFFVVFMVIFRFTATNMFLATQLNTFAALVGDRSVQELRDSLEKEKHSRTARYPSKDAVRKDIRVERNATDGEVYVTEILDPNGFAADKGVMVGHIVFKVNRHREIFRRVGITDIIEDGMDEDPKDHHIEILFQEPIQIPWYRRLARSCAPQTRKKKEAAPVGAKTMPTVKNFWRQHGALMEVKKQVFEKLSDEKEAEDHRLDGSADMAEDPHEDDLGIYGSDDRHAEIHALDPEDPNVLKDRVKKRLDALLFSRWPEGKVQKDLDLKQPAMASIFVPESAKPVEQLELTEADLVQPTWDVDDLRDFFWTLPLHGQEVWLDCLVAAMEHQMNDEEPIVTDLLRTANMHGIPRDKPLSGPALERVVKFYNRMHEVLKICENKANRKYFQHLRSESNDRQDKLRSQNEVLHDYVCELEKEFSKNSEEIQNYRTKKELMLKKLAGLLDRGEYSNIAGLQEQQRSLRNGGGDENSMHLTDREQLAISNE